LLRPFALLRLVWLLRPFALLRLVWLLRPFALLRLVASLRLIPYECTKQPSLSCTAGDTLRRFGGL
jgi:hypothetical protein